MVTLTLLLIQISSFNLPSAIAALGDDVSAVEKDRVRIAAKTAAPISLEKFTVHTISNDGLIIREYISKAGKIFAVAWDGNTSPDLEPLLGKYFTEFKVQNKSMNKNSSSAIKMKSRTARSAVVGNNVIVEKSGHMRNMHGKAYLPQFIPAGVSINEIQ